MFEINKYVEIEILVGYFEFKDILSNWSSMQYEDLHYKITCKTCTAITAQLPVRSIFKHGIGVTWIRIIVSCKF